jgi:hypothetical protein
LSFLRKNFSRKTTNPTNHLILYILFRPAYQPTRPGGSPTSRTLRLSGRQLPAWPVSESQAQPLLRICWHLETPERSGIHTGSHAGARRRRNRIRIDHSVRSELCNVRTFLVNHSSSFVFGQNSFVSLIKEF